MAMSCHMFHYTTISDEYAKVQVVIVKEGHKKEEIGMSTDKGIHHLGDALN